MFFLVEQATQGEMQIVIATYSLLFTVYVTIYFLLS